DTVTWRPASATAPGGVGGTTMVLADPAGGAHELHRREPSFTPAEYARAQALVELAATLARRDADRITLVLPDGGEVSVRAATAV
ncbi:GNAT family N-acetyltransferase, partial [Micromonospora aurantiaca]|nr:GNAT family N-acetyltransferase [Micromonospora aurantiaca]